MLANPVALPRAVWLIWIRFFFFVFNSNRLKFSGNGSKEWIWAEGKTFRKCSVVWPRCAPTSKMTFGGPISNCFQSFSMERNQWWEKVMWIRCHSFWSLLIVGIACKSNKVSTELLPCNGKQIYKFAYFHFGICFDEIRNIWKLNKVQNLRFCLTQRSLN